MAGHLNRDDGTRPLLDATCRVALAGLLHDLGKLAERGRIPVPDREILEINKQIYCPNPKPHPDSPGWFSHVHAAYTALALDAIEPDLPPIKGEDTNPFQEWGEARAGGADDSLINAAAKHHKPETFLQWIVATADRAASGLDREQFGKYNNARDHNPTTGKNHYTIRQYTLFEQIDIEQDEDSQRPEPTYNYRYPLGPLSPRNIFPVPADGYETNDRATARAEYLALWEKFREELKQIPRSHRQNLSLWLDHFDSLWMTFTHAVPAATAFGTIPDISLYDHSRVVAALATAIWRYHHERGDDQAEVRVRLAGRKDWNEPKLMFIQGDLFGIQDFIFASGGATTKNAAKLLRGRSFFVSLLTDCAALRVLDTLSLPPTSQIVNAAGKFQIIAPNTKRTIKKLGEARQDLDEWFLRHTFGQSGIGIAWTPATCNDLQQGSRQNSPYRRLVERLFDALENTKLQRFELCGRSPRGPVFDDYLGRIGEHGLCAVDGRSPADGGKLDDDSRASRFACDQIRIGERLTWEDRIRIGERLTWEDRNRLLVTRSPLDSPNVDSLDTDIDFLDTDIFGYRIGLTNNEEAAGRFGEHATTGNLLRVWDFSLPKDADAPLFHGYARRDINAWVPRFNENDIQDGSRYKKDGSDSRETRKAGDLKTFHDLAREARERRRSSDEPKTGPGEWIGVSALMTLKGDVDNLGAIFQRGLRAPSLSRIAALSRQMNAFFTVHLPHLCHTEFRNTYTVFAGGDDFLLIGPWTRQLDLASRLRGDFSRYVTNNPPIGFSAGLAMTKPGLPVPQIETIAEESLEGAKRFRRTDGRDKNAVTCFDRTVDWSDYRELLDARKRLRDLTSDMSHRYVYGLLQLVELAEGVPFRPENARWRSRFYYQTARALEKVRGLDRKQRLEKLATEIVREGIDRFGGDYRIALFDHLYRNRTQEG